MVKTVLLCGCGNIGFRHLQALAAIETDARIVVVEPNQANHQRIEDFIKSTDSSGPDAYTLLDRVPEERRNFDLVVIATRADVRHQVYESIVTRHDVGCIIFEKILFQSVAETDAVESDLHRRNIPAFVNCGRRGFDSYRDIASQFAGATPTDVSVTGGAFGLASNAVHFLDLAEFLNGSALTSLDLSGLQSGHETSKRDGLVEVFGTLRATLENGGTLSVTCDDTEAMHISIKLRHGDRDILIDELGNTRSEDGTTEPFGTKFVSGMPYLYDDALQKNDPGLTPYADSARQHRFYLKAMCGHLGLPVRDDTICPVS